MFLVQLNTAAEPAVVKQMDFETAAIERVANGSERLHGSEPMVHADFLVHLAFRALARRFATFDASGRKAPLQCADVLVRRATQKKQAVFALDEQADREAIVRGGHGSDVEPVRIRLEEDMPDITEHRGELGRELRSGDTVDHPVVVRQRERQHETRNKIAVAVDRFHA